MRENSLQLAQPVQTKAPKVHCQRSKRTYMHNTHQSDYALKSAVAKVGISELDPTELAQAKRARSGQCSPRRTRLQYGLDLAISNSDETRKGCNYMPAGQIREISRF